MTPTDLGPAAGRSGFDLRSTTLLERSHVNSHTEPIGTNAEGWQSKKRFLGSAGMSCSMTILDCGIP